jgi:hypothetical protein
LGRTSGRIRYLEAKKEVVELQSSLEPIFGFKPLLDGQIQDSTHSEEIRLWPNFKSECRGVIRFSRFGRLVTILFSERLSVEELSQILSELEKHRYVYIPATILESPYDGSWDLTETWMNRYFYYV